MFAAKDKVALLIGNGIYMSQRKLNAPQNDVLQVGRCLEKMNFKTLICKDLDKCDAEHAINLFVDLLIEGVYGKFSVCHVWPLPIPKPYQVGSHPIQIYSRLTGVESSLAHTS